MCVATDRKFVQFDNHEIQPYTEVTKVQFNKKLLFMLVLKKLWPFYPNIFQSTASWATN